jgi:hypothetical protein
MNYIYYNIIKPLLQILENIFKSRDRKEFIIIINFLDLVYHKGGNLLNNIIFIVIFPLMFLPLINLTFIIVGGSIITILDLVISILPIIKRGDLLNLLNRGYIIEMLCVCWNLFFIFHYTYSGMLKIRLRQTKNFLSKPLSIAYISKEYHLAYKNFRQTVK